MPKSGQSRKRYAAQARKKAAHSQPVAAPAPPVQGAPPRTVLTPAGGHVARTAAPPVLTDVKPELKRIGILTVIMVIVLVVLSRVLV